MPDFTLLFFIPLLFFVTFPLLWIGVSGILSLVGGWALLAEQFSAKQPETGTDFRFASALLKKSGMLPVTYRGSLFLTINRSGVSIAILFLFRFFSPPLFIPWSSIRSIDEQRHLFGSYGVINIRECPVKILVPGAAGRALLAEYARVHESDA